MTEKLLTILLAPYALSMRAAGRVVGWVLDRTETKR